MDEPTPELCDLSASTVEGMENSLDRVNAPLRGKDGRYLTLRERIDALADREGVPDLVPELCDLSASAVLGRFRDKLPDAIDAEVAARLGVARPNLSKWRRRNSVPYAHIVRACLADGIDLDWVLTGRFSAWTPGRPA